MKKIIRRGDKREDVKIYDFQFSKQFKREDSRDVYRMPKFHWEHPEETQQAEAGRKIFKKLDFTPLLDESSYGRPPVDPPPADSSVFPFFGEAEQREVQEITEDTQTLYVSFSHGKTTLSATPAVESKKTDVAAKNAPQPMDANTHHLSDTEVRARQQELNKAEKKLAELTAHIAASEAKINQLIEEEARHTSALEQAKSEASTVLAKAREEAAAVTEAARVVGHEAAKQELITIEAEKLDQVRQDYVAAVTRLNEAAKKFESTYLGAEGELIDLAVHIAGNIINAELQTNRLVIVGQVKKAIAELVNREKILIKVAREDYDAISKAKFDLIKEVSGLKTIDIEADEYLRRGSCVVENEYGSVQTDVKGSLSEIAHALKGEGVH
ncbi:FliH/SctL family protein [Chrysiogenes arsenatis]|uniref:FliH/SctL family protein n=1 Tax=Chrysiogenes arsenatis TaxID=309797 RepID=UPI00041E4EEA|nr:FliH/SctL family protein [Chrysiogenes arsenatis]